MRLLESQTSVFVLKFIQPLEVLNVNSHSYIHKWHPLEVSQLKRQRLHSTALIYVCWQPRISPFPHVQAKVILIFHFISVFLNATYHVRSHFQTALVSKGFSVVLAHFSTRSPGGTAAKLNLAFGNKFIHLIRMQLRKTNPNSTGK